VSPDEVGAAPPPQWTWDPSLYAGSAPFYAVERVGYPAEVADLLVAALGLDGSGQLRPLQRADAVGHPGHLALTA